MITINKKFTSVFFDMIQEEERYQQDRLSEARNLIEVELAKKSLEMVHKFKCDYRRDSKFDCWNMTHFYREFQEMLDNEMQYYSDYGHQAWTKEDKKRFKLIKEMVQDLLYQLHYIRDCGYERKEKHEVRFYNRFNAKPNENNNN